MSDDAARLPPPKGWRFVPRAGWARAVLYLAFTAGLLGGGAVVIAGGREPVTGYALLAGAVVAGGGTAMYWPHRRLVRPSLAPGPGGGQALTLPISRLPLVLCVVIGGGLALVALAVLADRRNGGAPPGFAAMLAAFAVVVLASCGLGLARHGRAGGSRVALDPERVTFVSMGRQVSLAWDHVERVVPLSMGLPFASQAMLGLRADHPDHVVSDRGGRLARRMLRLSRLLGAEVAVPVDSLAVDRTLAYWTLHYYATHPQARAELADERSVERVAAGDLV